MDQAIQIIYPRRIFIRRILKGLARLLVGLLVRLEVNGLDNLPKSGPYIVVGNHVSSLEPILMVILIPQQLEYLGAGDIPIDPRMTFITNLYQFIPIMRGQIDQKGLSNALEVLSQNGVLGIFPEGGIWEKKLKEPKLGTSWIAYKSKAPILPMGFIGMNGAIKETLSLKRPKVTVNIGRLTPFEELFPEDLPLKHSMSQGTSRIMEIISELLPPEKIGVPEIYDQRHLVYFYRDVTGIEKTLNFSCMEAFSKLIEHPVIMDVLKRNLKLPVKSLTVRNQPIQVDQLIMGLRAIQEYLELNPGFLSYRFGIDQAVKMKIGVESLLDYCEYSMLGAKEVFIRIRQDND